MKPTGPVFDSSWRAACVVERVNKREVDAMIQKHYIGKWPSDVVLTLGLIKKNKTLGMIVFTIPKKKIQERFGVNTWDLARLWIDDSVPKNAETFLIGKAVKIIRREHLNIHTLISFADPSMGHSGTIYKAANWKQEQHESMNLFSYCLK